MNLRRDDPKPAPIWGGLSTQMFLLVILPFAVLALAATLMSLGLHQNAMRAMVAERDTHAVGTAANYLESKIQAEQEAASAMAMYVMLASGSDADKLSAFARARAYSGKNLAYLSAQGKVLAFSGASEVQDALSGMALKSGEMQVDPVNGKQYLWLTATVETGGLVVNVVSIQALAQEVLGEHTMAMGESAAFIVDANRQVLASMGHMNWEGTLSTHPGVAEALRWRKRIYLCQRRQRRARCGLQPGLAAWHP